MIGKLKHLILVSCVVKRAKKNEKTSRQTKMFKICVNYVQWSKQILIFNDVYDVKESEGEKHDNMPPAKINTELFIAKTTSARIG